VGEEDASGADVEVGTFGPTMARDRSGLLIRPEPKLAVETSLIELRGEDPISKEDMRVCINIDDARSGTERIETDVVPTNNIRDRDSEEEFEALGPVNDSERNGDHVSVGATGDHISEEDIFARASTPVIWAQFILEASLTPSTRRLHFDTLPLANPN
jgi:hypothetical protein